MLKLCENCAFPQNFYTRKLHEIMVFYAMKGFSQKFAFFLSGFSFTDTGHSQESKQEKGGDHILFQSATSTRSRTFIHLFVTLQLCRWLSRIFNRTVCIYQSATR